MERSKPKTSKAIHIACFILLLISLGWSFARGFDVKKIRLPDGHIKQQVFDSSGVLTEEELFLDTDTGLVNDGYSRMFYPNGQISQERIFRKGEVDSVLLMYYDDGKLMTWSEIRDGAANGVFYSFYRNGDTFQKDYYLDNDKFGSQYRLDSGTHKIYQYQLQQHTNSYKLLLEYDKRDNVIERKGHPLAVELSKGKKVYDKTDTANITFVIARPPRAKASVKIFKNNFSKIAYQYTYADFHILEPANVGIKDLQYPCKEGTTKFLAICELTDTISNKHIIRDTTYLIIKVK